jgi:DNA ligase-1
MLCKSADSDRIAAFPSVYAEYKLDGIRVIAHVDQTNRKVKFTSRGGNEFPSCQHLADVVLEYALYLYPDKDCVLDGEVISGSFNNTVSQVRRLRELAVDAHFHVFDHLTKEEWDAGRSTQYFDTRRAHMERAYREWHSESDTLYKKQLSLTHCVLLPSQYEPMIEQMYGHALNVGLEGLILKNGKSHYICGKRSKHWLKMKAEETLDLPIIAVLQGGGKYGHCMGALVVLHNNVPVNVGTGFDDKDREAIWKTYESNPEDIIGRLIEVRFQYETEGGSLRHPSFVRFRDDK